MKFKYIHKYQGGGLAKQIEASFGLPEVNIYPQNEFGDIARSQGINRARNWKKVKEGTTKGINDFSNDPRTLMVMAGLPLPGLLNIADDAIKVIGPTIKNTKLVQMIEKIGGDAFNSVKTTVGPKIDNLYNSTSSAIKLKFNGSGYKSQIDWGKWNPEIPNNKSLLKEYHDIEKNTISNGTWMKNPDNTKFPGTKELFVQLQSKNFKKAFGDTKVLVNGRPQILTHNSPDKFTEFNLNKVNNGRLSGDGVYTFEEGLRKDYLPEFQNQRLRYPAKFNQTKYGDIEYNLYGNSPKPRVGAGQFDDITKNSVEDGFTSTRVVDDINSKHIHVFPDARQLKSAIGNNGMFDMTNPNIYKTIAIGTALNTMNKTDKNK